MDEKQLQQEYFQYQYLQKQAEAMQNQLNQVREAISETSASIQSLENLNDEALFSIGSGVLVRAKANSEKVLLDVGSRVVIEKTIPDAISFLNKKLKNLESGHEKIVKNMGQVVAELQSKEEILRAAQERGS